MKTLYAILSDIHGNFPALQAVEADAKKMANDNGATLKFVCLGDIVDYGPQPNECVEWVKNQKHMIMLLGNHDEDVLDDPKSWHPVITVWTHCALKNDNKEWLRKQKADAGGVMYKVGVNGLADFTFLHSSLGEDKHQAYIYNLADYNRERELCRTRYALFGHTHQQMYFTHLGGGKDSIMFFAVNPNQRKQLLDKPRNKMNGLALIDEWLPFDGLERGTFLNPGSVGQPRKPGGILEAQFTPHGAYLLIRHQLNESPDFMFRQVSYDVDKTINLIKEKMTWATVEARKSLGNPILTEGSVDKKPSQISTRIARYIKDELPRMHSVLSNTLNYG